MDGHAGKALEYGVLEAKALIEQEVNDCSGNISLMWDENYLYFAAERVDDVVHVTNETGVSIYKGDTIVYWLHITDGAKPGTYQIGFAQTKAQGAEAFLWVNLLPTGRETFPPKDVKIQIREVRYRHTGRVEAKNFDGIVFEASMSLTDLGLSLKEGLSLPYAVSLMKKSALYVRVSTSDQDPTMQLSDLRRYAQQRGFEIYKEYVDVGVSGTKANRPALDALMSAARKRLFDVVLVWRFDRFARSTRHLVDALYEFRSLSIDFISYQEAIDTSSPIGEAMFTIISAMAKLERDIIVERVKAGMRKAKEQGKRIGRPKAVVDVETIISLREQGLSMQAIAERVKYKDSKGRWRNVSKGKVHRILKKHGLTNLDFLRKATRKTCTVQVSGYIAERVV